MHADDDQDFLIEQEEREEEARLVVADIARVQRADAAFNLLRRDRDNHDPYLLLAAVVWPETTELRGMV
jgi:hypothetical protein